MIGFIDRMAKLEDERLTVEVIDLTSVMQLIHFFHKILLDKLIQIGLAEELSAQIESWTKTHKAKVVTNSHRGAAVSCLMCYWKGDLVLASSNLLIPY